jgi:hypothetical protein
MIMGVRTLLFAGMLAALAQPLAAQETAGRFFVEGRTGAVIPTFDIADVARTGFALGGTVGYHLGRVILMGEFDYGMHKYKATESIDITTLHYMAKVGYQLTPSRDRGLDASVNLGLGAVTFDVDGGDSFTYPAINAGAKLAYHLTPTLSLVLSPQGDIAFSDQNEVGSSTAWVWPVTAGLRLRF